MHILSIVLADHDDSSAPLDYEGGFKLSVAIPGVSEFASARFRSRPGFTF